MATPEWINTFAIEIKNELINRKNGRIFIYCLLLFSIDVFPDYLERIYQFRTFSIGIFSNILPNSKHIDPHCGIYGSYF